MRQKVLRVGTSAAVTIPKKSLQELGLKIGDEVSVDIDRKMKSVIIRPEVDLSKEDMKILDIGKKILEKYRADFRTLATK